MSDPNPPSTPSQTSAVMARKASRSVSLGAGRPCAIAAMPPPHPYREVTAQLSEVSPGSRRYQSRGRTSATFTCLGDDHLDALAAQHRQFVVGDAGVGDHDVDGVEAADHEAGRGAELGAVDQHD